jgi:hypothetical protein
MLQLLYVVLSYSLLITSIYKYIEYEYIIYNGKGTYLHRKDTLDGFEFGRTILVSQNETWRRRKFSSN